MKPGKTYFCMTVLIMTLTLLSPMITESMKYCPRDSSGNILIFWIGIVREKDIFFCRMGIVVLILLLNIIQQYVQVVRPYARMEELRKASFDQIILPVFERINKGRLRQARLSIMKKTTYLHLSRYIWLCSLSIIYEAGFGNQDLDRNLRYLAFRFFGYYYYQGPCGLTLAKESASCINLSSGRQKHCRFTSRQREKTKELKYVITIPLIKHNPERSTYRIAGVMSIDTKSEAAAACLDKNEAALKKYIKRFDIAGSYAAMWM